MALKFLDFTKFVRVSNSPNGDLSRVDLDFQNALRGRVFIRYEKYFNTT
jgi:hypothetical protein